MANQNAVNDDNKVKSILVQSTTNPRETVALQGDPLTGGLVVSGGGGSATSGSTSTGTGTVAKAVARPQANKQTRTNNQISDITTDENENQWVRETYAPLYEDNVAGVAKTEQRYTSFATSAAGTTTIKTGSGFIQTITILGGTLGNITVYDNTAGSGTAILPTFLPTAAVPAPSIDVYATFSTGLTIVTAAATVIQISYR